MRSGAQLIMTLAGLSTLACGRTEALWWTDVYAEDTGTEGDGDGDGDGDTSSTGTSTTTTGDGDGDGDTDTTDTDTTDTTSTTDTTDTDTTDTTGCEDVPLGLTADAAKVVFLVDQGVHMGLDFGGQTRWEAIGEALFDMQQGVAWAWEDQRQLGLVTFTSFNGDQGGLCPVVEVVDPLLSNGTAMELAFAGQNPADDNPVADAITSSVPLFAGEPGHLLLITGRNPDTCATQSPQPSVQAAVVAAQDAFAAEVQTRVIEVGNINGNYAQALANAGVGLDPQGMNAAPYWEPVDTGALTQDLDAILASLSSCELTLDQALAPGGEVFCTFELDGMALTLDDPDGWSVAAPDRVTLDGSACDSFSQGATPDMICGCEAF